MTYCPLWTSRRCLPGKHLSLGGGGTPCGAGGSYALRAGVEVPIDSS